MLEKNVLQFLFIVVCFLSLSLFLRGFLFIVNIDNHAAHLITSILILGGSYGYAKIKYIHFTRKKKYTFIAVLLSCAFLFWIAQKTFSS